jgi:hypothetical protein
VLTKHNELKEVKDLDEDKKVSSPEVEEKGYESDSDKEQDDKQIVPPLP